MLKKYLMALMIFMAVMFSTVSAFAAINYASNADVSFRGGDGKRVLDANSGIYFASYAVDGDTSTCAIAGGEYAWQLFLDLKSVKESIGEVAITFADDKYIAPAYEVLVSTDGEKWVTVATVAKNDNGQRRVHAFSPQPVRYIRIADTVVRNANSMRIAEVEVYSTAGTGKLATLKKPAPGSVGVDVNGEIIIGFDSKMNEKYAYKAKLTDVATGKEVACHRYLDESGYNLTMKPYIRLERGKKYKVSFENFLEEEFVTWEADPMKNVEVHRYGRLSMLSTTQADIIEQNKLAVDGDLSTSVVVNDSNKQFFGSDAMVLELDLKKVYENISRVEISFGGSIPTLIYIKASQDGKTWENIERIYTQHEKNLIVDFEPISARYIQVHTAEGVMDIAEISAKCIGAVDEKPTEETEEPEDKKELSILSVSSDSYMSDKENAIYPAFVDNLDYEAWTEEGSTKYYQIKAEGGEKPYTFKITDGRLPEGLSMSEDGKISGRASKEETTEFTISLADASGKEITKQLSMTAHPYRSKWFADAKFGLMTQWGPNAVTFAEYSYDGYNQAWNGTQKQIEYFENMYKNKFDAAKWADEIEQSGAKVFNYMVCAGNGIRLYPSKVESTVNAKLNMDMIGSLIEELHKRGIKFIGYMAPENSWADKFNDKDIETQSVSKLRINMLRELFEMGMDGVWIDAGWTGLHADWEQLIATMRTTNPFATLQSNPSTTKIGYTPMYPYVDIQTVECLNGEARDTALHIAYHAAVSKKMAVEQTGLLGTRWLGYKPVKSPESIIKNIKENWKNGVTYLLVIGPDQYGDNFIDPNMRKEYDEIIAWVKENKDSEEYAYKEADLTPTKIGEEKLISDVSVIDKTDIAEERNSVLTGMEIQVGKYPIELTSIGRLATGKDGERHHFAIYRSGKDVPYLLSGEMKVADVQTDSDGFMYYDFAPVRLEAFTSYLIFCEEDIETAHYRGDIKSVNNEYIRVRNGMFTDISWTQRYNSESFYPNSHQLLNLKFDVLYDEAVQENTNVAWGVRAELRDNEDNIKGASGEIKFAINAVDGDYESAAAAAYAYAWTLWVDLEKEYSDINNIKLTFGEKIGFATEFEIYASTDNVNWERITYVNESEELKHDFKYEPFAARYFKVRSLKPNARGQLGGQMAIHEFEVYTAEN